MLKDKFFVNSRRLYGTLNNHLRYITNDRRSGGTLQLAYFRL